MATLDQIVRFGQQPSPLIQGLQSIVPAAKAIGDARRRNNRQEAANLLGQAFSDEVSDPAEIDALRAQARELDPEYTFQIEQAVAKRARDMQQTQKTAPYQQVKTEGLEGYTFDPNTGTYAIDEGVKAALDAKAEAAKNKGVQLDAKGRQSIAKDVTGLTKNAVGISNSADSLRGLKKSSSSAAKLAAVFSFMKAMDPSSTVRESEQGQVYNAEGAAKGLANRINAMLGKGGLSDEGFQDLVNTADNLAQSAISSARNEVSAYLDSYEDTIPTSFRDTQLNRIPKLSTSIGMEVSDESNKDENIVNWNDM